MNLTLTKNKDVFIRLAMPESMREEFNHLCSRPDIKRSGIHSVSDALRKYIERCLEAEDII